LRRHKGSPSGILAIALTTIVFCVSLIGQPRGEQPGPDQQRQAEPAAARLRVTGRGHPPQRAMSESQSRIMAKRAAMLEAFKNMAKALGKVQTHLTEGTGHESVNGFIKGMELMETRYYPNKDVEVDIELAIQAQDHPEGVRPSPAMEGACAKEKPILIEKGGGRISVSEWKKIFGSGH
jgi:hypothetical protein